MSIKGKAIFIVDAKRTPFCKHGGSLRDLPSSHIFAAAAKDALQSAKLDPKLVDTTIVGNIHFDIITGMAKTTLTGGTENMSTLPYLVRGVRFGIPLGSSYQLEDYIPKERPDSFVGKTLQKLAEDLAKKYGVTKEMIEEYTTTSHLKWKTAQEANVFAEEITPMTVTIMKKNVLVDRDEILQGGGNCAVPADGASAILLADEDTLTNASLQPLARIAGWTTVGVSPLETGLGAAVAIKKLVNEEGLKMEQVDLFEINETFASQALMTIKELNIDSNTVNINGGALALGHPESATGTRMVTHLVHQIRRGKARKAIAASSCGGGQGITLLLEQI